MDDIEAIASLLGLSRENLRFYPESHGGSVAGRLVIVDQSAAAGERIEIDCARLGVGAYRIGEIYDRRLDSEARQGARE